MESRIIIVANRLPVSVYEADGVLGYRTSPGGMAAALAPLLSVPETRWVGCTGVDRKLAPAELAALDLPDQLVPVQVAPELYRRYYYGVANGSLWPLLHGFRPKRLFDEADWRAALAVTAEFARAVLELAGPDDVIWVHDFHLMMLPKLLRDGGCRNRIGYFLHTPFAGAEFFSQLPHHELMLESLGMADICGFQTEPDAMRFRDYANEVLGGAGFRAGVGAFPVGIGYETYRQARSRPEVAKRLGQLERDWAGRTVIFSVSRLDYTKGILEQLEAIYLLLSAPGYERVVYKLVVAPSREDLEEYSDLKREIVIRVRQINRRLGRTAVDYDYRTIGFEELASWYLRAEVMLVAPLVDGMNLVAKEYVATRPDDDGVLVLSDKAGAAIQLNQAVLVDPTRPDRMAAALGRAVAMPEAERRRRQRALRRAVEAEDAEVWAQRFIEALKRGN